MESETTITKPTAGKPRLPSTRCGCCYRRNVDILEEKDELLVLADVPGTRSDSIDVRFEDGMLEIAPRWNRDVTTDRDTWCRNTALATTFAPFR